MPNELENMTNDNVQSAKGSASQVANAGIKVGRTAAKAGRTLKNGAAKGVAAIGRKVLSFIAGILKIIGAIIAAAPVIIAVVLIGAIFLGLAYTWFMEDRGTSQDRTLSSGSSNPTYIDGTTGALTADRLTEPQAILDAYYKYMACQSYTKEYAYLKDDGTYEIESVTFHDDTEDFAGLTDYSGGEGSYYLSPDLILMADEVLHKGEFRWPEHIITPVNHEFSEYTDTEGNTRIVVETQPLRDDFGHVDKELVRQTGLGSVILYEPDTKDDYVSAKITSFQLDFDKATTPASGVGDPSYSHVAIETFTVSDTDTYETISSAIQQKVEALTSANCHSDRESIVTHGLDEAMLKFFFNGGKRTRTVNEVETEYTIDHMPQAVLGKDKEIDSTTFNNTKLNEAFGNDSNGLYPITVPTISSVATMSGNVRYTYYNEAQGNVLQTGSSENIYDPVNQYAYNAGCKGGLSEDKQTLIAQKSGVHYVSFPVVVAKNPDPDRPEETREERDIEIGNPWAYDYFDDYTANYSGDVPQTAYDDPDFFDRLHDEETISMLKQLGLLVEKGSALGAVGTYTADDLELLARVIRQEAGSNKLDELLVASVVMNRVASDLFPNTVIDVINQEGQYASADNLYDADPTDSDWDSAKRVLSGEFAIPSNILYQSGDASNGEGLWLENVNSATGADWEATHYYCWQGGGSVSNVDRFGRTALTASEAQVLARQMATAPPSVSAPSVESGEGEGVAVSGADEDLYYAVTEFDPLTATNVLRKISKPDTGFTGLFSGLFTSASDFFSHWSNRFFSFNTAKPADPETGEEATETVRYDYTPHETDRRRIIYQAITFRDSLTYGDVKNEWERKANTFLFMGDKVFVSEVTIVSEVGSALPNWVSPTGIPSSPISAEAGPSGKGVILPTLAGESVQALYDGVVTATTVDSVTIRYNATDGVVYSSTYSGLSEVLVTTGTEVHTRDLVGKAGTYQGTQGFLFEFYCENTLEYLLPMDLFYQTVYLGGGGDIVSLALAEATAYRSNPMGFDTGKYERWMKGTVPTGEPWCANFVSWCYGQCYGNPARPKSASSSTLLSQAQEAGVFYPSMANGGSYTPQPGDIIVFRWDNATTPASHVGLVVGVEGDLIVTVEGNSSKPDDVPIVVYSNGLWRKTRPLDMKNIVGYCHWSAILTPTEAT